MGGVNIENRDPDSPIILQDITDTLGAAGYSCGLPLGTGGYAQVFRGVHTHSGCHVAIKILSNNTEKPGQKVDREFAMLSRLNHPAIIKLLDIVDCASRRCVVMEYAPLGTLLEYVRSKKRLVEEEAAPIACQLADALSYCHTCMVVHRDVKLENVVIDEHQNVKLIDFGLAGEFVPGKRMGVYCGSPSYAAPEICSKREYHGPPVDVWSLGIVIYAMLCGYLPFQSPIKCKSELCRKIVVGRCQYPHHISPLAKDLLKKMLTVEPNLRITLPEVLSHSWLQGHSFPGYQCNGAYQGHVSPFTGKSLEDEAALENSRAPWECSAQCP